MNESTCEYLADVISAQPLVYAKWISSVRQWMISKGLQEIITPVLRSTPSIDQHVVSMQVTSDMESLGFLQTSPEYAIKVFLGQHRCDVFEITKAFRVDHQGPWHHPEFMMLEWYRADWDHWRLIKEVGELLLHYLPKLEITTMSYQTFMMTHLGMDPLVSDIDTMIDIAIKRGFHPPEGVIQDQGLLLDWLMGVVLSNDLASYSLLCLYHFPASQAALSRLVPNHPEWSERFEFYAHGIELANGYHELCDIEQCKQRWQFVNHRRQLQGKAPLPWDYDLLDAMSTMGQYAGVALGLDRLYRLIHKT